MYAAAAGARLFESPARRGSNNLGGVFIPEYIFVPFVGFQLFGRRFEAVFGVHMNAHKRLFELRDGAEHPCQDPRYCVQPMKRVVLTTTNRQTWGERGAVRVVEYHAHHYRATPSVVGYPYIQHHLDNKLVQVILII